MPMARETAHRRPLPLPSSRALPCSPSSFLGGSRAVSELLPLVSGPRNSAVSTTTNCPSYPGCDGKYYGRYVVYFRIYASGERATLVGVSDSYGRTPDYTQQQYNESLPNSGRQG